MQMVALAPTSLVCLSVSLPCRLPGERRPPRAAAAATTSDFSKLTSSQTAPPPPATGLAAANERRRGEDGRTNILPFRRKSELALAQIIGSSVHCSRFLKRNIYSFRFTLGSIFHIGFKTR